MLNLNDLYFFVQVIEQGGFSAASRHLGKPKSTISKRVAALEECLGARLIHRSSRSFSLTNAGHDFFDHARGALIEAEAAENVVRLRLAEPSGTVRLTASVPTAQFDLADHLPAFALAHPKVHLLMHATDRLVDVVQEGYDIAIRSHFAPLPDSGLIQRRIAIQPMFLVAAPSYLDRRGVPGRPADLVEHDGFPVGPGKFAWVLRDQNGVELEVTPKPRMTADESLVLLKAAAAGLGIARLPEGICRSFLESGELIRLLPDWTSGEVTTTILVPHRRGQLPAVRAVVEFLSVRLAETRSPVGDAESD